MESPTVAFTLRSIGTVHSPYTSTREIPKGRGIDMLDGTPVLDLKPYLSSIPEEKLRRGWLAEAEARGNPGVR